jgi:hypothetical protein
MLNQCGVGLWPALASNGLKSWRIVGRPILAAAAFQAAPSRGKQLLAPGQSRLKAGRSHDWLPHFWEYRSRQAEWVILQVPLKYALRGSV